MIDLDKLKNIDLQNIDLSKIDVNKIFEALLSKKDVFVSVVVAIVTVLIAIALTKNFFTQTSTLENETALLKTKIEVIGNYRSSQSKIKKFINTLPKSLDEDSMASTVTEIAASSNMSIVSLVPGQVHSEELYTQINMGIDVVSPSFSQLLIFLKAMESSGLALRVDSCAVLKTAEDRMNNRLTSGMNAAKKNNDAISVHLDLTSVQLKK